MKKKIITIEVNASIVLFTMSKASTNSAIVNRLAGMRLDHNGRQQMNFFMGRVHMVCSIRFYENSINF